MHYSNLVIIDKPTAGETVESLVNERMGDSADWFDWFQIGGRFTGLFDGYEPDADPANLRPCGFCGATGTRTDMVVENGCNACHGTGKVVTHPTEWGVRDGDSVPLESVTDQQYGQIYRVVCDYGRFDVEEYRPWADTDDGKFVKKDLPPLAWLKENYPGRLAVIVDNHN